MAFESEPVGSPSLRRSSRVRKVQESEDSTSLKKSSSDVQAKKPTYVLKKIKPVWTEEIHCMMHIFGDVKNPLPQSVCLVEKVLREQMNMLLSAASKALPSNRKTELTHEHLLLLIYKNKLKLKRLLHHLRMRDIKEYINVNSSRYEAITAIMVDCNHGKKVKACMEFLKTIEEHYDFDALLMEFEDPLTIWRNKRRFLSTSHLNTGEYMEYSKWLQTTFLPKDNVIKFSKWLAEDNITNLVPTKLAVEIINHFARETVAEIVESSLIVKNKGYISDHPSFSESQGMPRISESNPSLHDLEEAGSLPQEQEPIFTEDIKEVIYRSSITSPDGYATFVPFKKARLLCL